MKGNHRLATLALALLCSLPAAASAPDILGFQHENLRNGQTEALDGLRGEASFLLFFQPDCKWCLKQSRTLDKLLARCPDRLNAAALGVHASRHELKKELQRLRPDYPAYKTGNVMLSELQGVPATPVMLLTDQDGRFAQSFRGYVPEDELAEILKDQHKILCTM